jgi:hypothetical protein
MNPKFIKPLLIGVSLILLAVLVFQIFLNRELSKQVNAKEASELMTLQEKCHQQAVKAANAPNYKPKTPSPYSYHDLQSHYNLSQKKCFALITHELTNEKNEYLSHSQTLIDAFENRDYGSYIWVKKFAKGAIFYDENPHVCNIRPSLTEEKICSSLTEFKSLIKPYME